VQCAQRHEGMPAVQERAQALEHVGVALNDHSLVDTRHQLWGQALHLLPLQPVQALQVAPQVGFEQLPVIPFQKRAERIATAAVWPES